MNENEAIARRLDKYRQYLLLAVILAFSGYVRIRLLSVPLERDEGEFAYFAQLILHGVPPYLDAYTLKLPGAALMYALFMLMFGQSAWGIHLGLLVVNALTVIMVFLLGRRLFGSGAGATAAAAYAVLSLSQGVYGVFAHATHFVVLFALAGYLLLMRALERGRTVTLLCSGLCFGLAILMKQHGIFFAVFALLYFLWERRKFFRGEWQRPIRDGLLFAAAIVVPFGACSLWLFMSGAFGKFWFWTFQYAREYVSSESLHSGARNFQRLFGRIVETSLYLWALAGIGLVLLFADREAARGRLFAAGLLFGRFGTERPGAKGHGPLILGHPGAAFLGNRFVLRLSGKGVLLFHGPGYGKPHDLWRQSLSRVGPGSAVHQGALFAKRPDRGTGLGTADILLFRPVISNGPYLHVRADGKPEVCSSHAAGVDQGGGIGQTEIHRVRQRALLMDNPAGVADIDL